MNYVTGKVIRELREKKNLTQRQLAELLTVSDKAVSKWETDRGLPDIGIIGSLAEALSVSVAELLAGEYTVNENRSGNMKKLQFYVCPVCGNVIQALGQGAYSCCGIALPPLEIEETNANHEIVTEMIENEYFVHIDHPMTKQHYISFIAYAASDHAELIKLYPEQGAEGRFSWHGHGYIYTYCNRHGLYRIMI